MRLSRLVKTFNLFFFSFSAVFGLLIGFGYTFFGLSRNSYLLVLVGFIGMIIGLFATMFLFSDYKW